MASSYYNHHYNKLEQDLFISIGGDTNLEMILINGENAAVGVTQEDIWSPGTTLSYLTSAETMEITSNDTDDSSAGTGARTIKIHGLNGSYVEISETVTMDGTNDVTTSNSYLRVHKLEVITAGSQGENDGLITATATSAGTLQAEITAEYNHSMMTQYTVPAGKSSVLHHIHSTCPVKNNEDALMHFEARLLNSVFKKILSYHVTQGSVSPIITSNLVFPEKTDFKLVGKRIDSTDCRVAANYCLININDSIIT